MDWETSSNWVRDLEQWRDDIYCGGGLAREEPDHDIYETNRKSNIELYENGYDYMDLGCYGCEKAIMGNMEGPDDDLPIIFCNHKKCRNYDSRRLT